MLAESSRKSKTSVVAKHHVSAWSQTRLRGRKAEKAGLLDKAASMHDSAIELARESNNKLDLAESLRDRGELNYSRGKAKLAIQDFEQSLAILDSEGTNKQMLDPLLLRLADGYTEQGKPAQAESHLKRLLDARTQVLPLDGKEVMPIYAKYISCLESQAKSEQLQRVCASLIANGHDWSTNRTLIKRLTELAMFLSERKQYAPVVYLLKPVHEQVRTKITEHTSRPASVLLQKLVVAMRETGRFSEAENLLREDIANRLKNWPADAESLLQERQLLTHD